MNPTKPSTDYNPLAPTLNPLQPRPKLLLVLSIVFVLWVALLLTMYFTTVYPHRRVETRPSTMARATIP